MPAKLTHANEAGEARMVDIAGKRVTRRRAVASGCVRLTATIADALCTRSVAKGNVLEVARIGAIQAAKRTADLVPLCHPVPISHISVSFQLIGSSLFIRSEVTADARTGVEMEALTATSVAALIVYDMCKGIDKGMEIGPIKLLEKTGGKSGAYRSRDAGGAG